MSCEYTWNPLDDGTDCVHASALAYGNIFRTKRDDRVCHDGRKIHRTLSEKNVPVPVHDNVAYTPSYPPKPLSYPINRLNLEKWKQEALKKASSEKMKRNIRFFANHVKHVPFETFTHSLGLCFKRFKKLFPRHEYFSVTPVDSEKSDRWVEDIALEYEWITIPEEWIGTWTDTEKVFFKSEDAMYSGSSFADDVMKIDHFPFVYVCPYVAGGVYFDTVILEELRFSTRASKVEAKVKKIFFVSAESGLCTHEIKAVNEATQWEFVEHNPMTVITDPEEKAIVFIYFNIMQTSPEGEAIPFYFDHKVADDYSWGNNHEVSPDYSWMFAGLHEIPVDLYSGAQEKTSFIDGCSAFQGNLQEKEDQGCPARPPWAHSKSKKNDDTI